MSVSELRRLSLKELDDLISKAQAIRSEKLPEERARVKAELATAARARGFSLEEIFGNGKALKRRPIVPKWRNPSNPHETWSGRGRAPRWFNQRTAIGL